MSVFSIFEQQGDKISMEDSAIRRKFINTYLDSPIIEADALNLVVALHEVRSIRSRKEKVPLNLSNASRMLDLLPTQDVEVQMYDPHDIKWMIKSLPTSGRKTYTTDAHNIAQELYKECCSKLGSLVDCSVKEKPLDSPWTETRHYLNMADLFIQYTDKMAVNRAGGGRRPIRVDSGSNFLIGTQYSAIWGCSRWDIAVVVPYEGVLMFKDMLLARANVFDTVRVVYGPGHELRNIVSEALDWCLNCLETHGNKGYEVLKNIESISKAFVIDKEDQVFKGRGPLQRLAENVRTKERLFGTRDGFLIDDLLAILSKCCLTQSVVEVFGLQKTSGHPLVDPRVGGKSAAEEASMPRDTLYSDAIELRNNWRRMYLEGYVRKSKRWPRMEFTKEGKSTRLYQLYSNRERKINRSSYPLSDWDHAKFLAHVDFEYYENYLDLMDDKAISFYLTEFRATWRKDVRPRSHKRLLLEMLTRPDISIRKIIELVETGDLPADWMIVSLYPKEREFKLSARMFSMMVFEMRVFFACLESNLADKIFPYLPQQTMTLKKTEIQEKFYSLTKPSVNPDVARLFLEVDLTRWNLRWRDLPIRLIGEDLNDIFGLTRSYTLVHSFFKNCMILVRVSNYEPHGLDQQPPPSSDLLWYDHEGGFEGIAQKHWTLATYSMIDLGLKDQTFNYNIIGQADNQIVLAYVDVSDDPQRDDTVHGIAEVVTQDIASSCSKVGQDAKPDECLESTACVTYSKDFFINGADVFMTLKAFSRIFPRGTTEFPTVINYVGSIGSGCVAASERLKDSAKGYYLMVYHVSRYILSLQHRVCLETTGFPNTSRARLTPVSVRMIVCIPSSLGGLPIPSFSAFLYKGGADALAKDVANIQFLPEDLQVFSFRCINEIVSLKWTKSDHRSSSILQDPYSLPISAVPLAESRVQKTSLEHVKEASKPNKDIRELVSENIDEFEGNLTSVLMKVTPFNPAFLADLLDNSIVGVKTTISKMFTSTRTIQELTHGDESDPGGSILRASSASFNSVVHRLLSVGSQQYRFVDAYRTTKELRSTWTKLKIDPTPSVEGVTSYVPFGWEIVSQNRKPRGNEIQITFIGGAGSDSTRGPYNPYLGTDTHEKRTKYGYKIVTSSSAEKASARLYTIMTQPGVSQTFEHLIEQIAATRTGADLYKIKSVSSKAIGGNIGHRFISIFDMASASIIGSGTFAGHVVLDSNYAGQLSGSTKDYKVFFQEMYSAGIGCLNFLYQRGHIDPITIGFIVPEDLEALPDDDVESEFSLNLPVPALRENKIAFTDDLRLLRQERPYVNRLLGETKGNLDLESSLALAKCASARELRRGSSAYTVSDIKESSIRLSLDVLEYRGIGLDSVLSGVAESIADHTYHSLFVRVGTKWRWTAMPLISALSKAFSHSIVRASTHPMFAQDRVTLEIVMPSDMSYSYYKAAGRISREIAVRAHKAFVSRPSSDPSSALLLFLDDEETASLEVCMMLYRKGLVLGVMAGEISSEQAYEFNRKTVLQRVRAATDSQQKLNALYGAALVTLDYTKDLHLTEMMTYYESLCRGNQVVLVDGTLAESLRFRRRFDMTTALIPVAIPASVGLGLPDPILTEGLVVRQVEDRRRTLHLQGGKYKDEEWTRFKFRRSRTRVYGFEAPAVHSFWPARKAIRSNTLIILGSGNGGCAAVAEACQIPRIILHDLQSDLIPESWMRPAVTLPTLRRIKSISLIERSRSGFGAGGGDLRDRVTWVELSNLAPIDTCIVYDIPFTNTEDFIHLLGKCSVHFPGSPIVLRWILKWTDIDLLVSVLVESYKNLEIYPVYFDKTGAEVITRITVQAGEVLMPASGSLDVGKVWRYHPNFDNIEMFGGSSDKNWLLEFADLNVETSDEEHLLSHNGISLTDDAESKGYHGYTYSEWTRILWYKAALALRESNPFDQEDMYIEPLTTGRLSVKVSDKTLSVSPTHSFRSFWTNTVPRCL